MGFDLRFANPTLEAAYLSWYTEISSKRSKAVVIFYAVWRSTLGGACISSLGMIDRAACQLLLTCETRPTPHSSSMAVYWHELPCRWEYFTSGHSLQVCICLACGVFDWERGGVLRLDSHRRRCLSSRL